jgi:hypothetical protein
MRDEYSERNGRGLINLLLIILVIGLIVGLFWKFGAFDKPSEKEETPSTEAPEVQASTPLTITAEQWDAVQNELAQLRNEVADLQQQLKQTNKTTPAKTTTQTTTKPVATTATPQTTIVSANDVTLANYSHEFLGSTARLSLKNNTDKIITSITGRIIYYDMSGNMLDYQDFTKSTTIDPGMVKSIDLKGFRTYDSYVYYKSNNANLGNKYKVKFELQSYKVMK